MMAVEAVEAQPRLAPLGAAVTFVLAAGMAPVLVRFIRLSGLTVAVDGLWLGAGLCLVLLHGRGDRLSWESLRRSAPGGAAFGLSIVFFVSSVKLTTVTDATIINALQPALVFVVAGRLFGERITLSHLAWSALAIAGVAVVLAGGGSRAGGDVIGDSLAAGALFAWAWYFVASKTARRALGALEYQAGAALMGAVVVTPVVLAAGATPLPQSLGTAGWLLVMALGGGGAHLLLNWAHAHVRLPLTSLLTLACPVISAAGAAVVLGEPLAALQIAGMVLTIGALAAIVPGMSRSSSPQPLPNSS